MKKFTEFFAVIAALVAIAATFTLFGCKKSGGGLDLGDGTGNYIAKQTDTEVVFIGTTEVLKEHDEYSLFDYMTALKMKNQLTFDGNNGDYGFFITTVNGKEATGNSFWGVYISFKTLEGDDAVYAGGEYETQYQYESTTLYSANYGVSGIPYVSGATYALVLQTY